MVNKKGIVNYTLVDDEDFEKFGHLKWFVNPYGYVIHTVNSPQVLYKRKVTAIFLAREIMNCPKGLEVDHINRDKLDNRKQNLRIVTGAINCSNRDLGKSGFVGVSFHERDKRWRAKRRLNGKLYYFGGFHTFEEAKRAYEEGSRRLGL